MNTWTGDGLDRFGAAEEIEIAPIGGDGALRRAVTIWTGRLGDNLYVRSAYGRSVAWFRAAETHHEGRISSRGHQADTKLNEETDRAYRAKYRRNGQQYVNMMT